MHHFFAYMARLKQIRRWGLMRNAVPENDSEHALQCAMIAHALATLQNVRHGDTLHADHIATLALYHDAGEVITGDIATPIKHFNPAVREAMAMLEGLAQEKLLTMLPSDLQPTYQPLLSPDWATQEARVVKAADRLCALFKCEEELRLGNKEFEKARAAILADVVKISLPAVQDFLEAFAESFRLSLDELN